MALGSMKASNVPPTPPVISRINENALPDDKPVPSNKIVKTVLEINNPKVTKV